MSKPRVVVPIVVQFSLRYVFRTGLLERMTEYAEPIVLLRWHDQELIEEFEQAGIVVLLLPETGFQVGYTRIKRQLE